MNNRARKSGVMASIMMNSRTKKMFSILLEEQKRTKNTNCDVEMTVPKNDETEPTTSNLPINSQTTNNLESIINTDLDVALQSDIIFLNNENDEMIIEETAVLLETNNNINQGSNVITTNDAILTEPPPEICQCIDGPSTAVNKDDNLLLDQQTSNEDREESFIERKQRVLSAKQQRKLLKDSGEEYSNYKGRVIEAKKMLENPCHKKSCHNKCNTFSEEERKQIFANFYQLESSDKQKLFLNDCTSISNIKRRRKSKGVKQRTVTNEYYLPKNKIKQRVCLQFLTNTLAISHRLIRTVLSNKEPSKLLEPDLRGKHVPHNKISEEQMNNFKQFMESLPAVPSHYCRGSSAKKYLPSEIKSYNNLHRIYVNEQKKINQPALKKLKFLQLVKAKYNIGIHVPRKDKCLQCEKFRRNNNQLTEIDEEKYKIHIKEKDAAKTLFLSEQSRSSKENSFLVASFDLQKVLSTPHGDSMLLGFSRKYAVYNFTVYETNIRKGYCYLWGEKDGKRGSNEICTNLYSYLKKVDDEKSYKEVSLYCDNCGGQNKNKAMFYMIRYFLDNCSYVNKINLIFLITGHTYMPVDSMHGVIEKSLKNKIVQAPSEWPTMLRNARIHPEPYVIIEQNYQSFLDFKSLNSKTPLKLKIANIRLASFFKNDFWVKYKTSFCDNKEYSVDLQLKENSVPQKIYSKELPINIKKFNNLKKLCETHAIEAKYHFEYLSLKSNNNLPDVLDETDIEDLE